MPYYGNPNVAAPFRPSVLVPAPRVFPFPVGGALPVSTSDTATFTESLGIVATVAIVPDSALVTDSLQTIASVSALEVVVFSDSLAISIPKAITDTATESESSIFTAALAITDGLSFTETVVVTDTQTVVDTVAFSDSFVISASNAVTDTSVEIDKLSVIASVGLIEISIVTDTIVSNAASSLADTAVFSESLVIAVAGGITVSVIDTAVFSESLVIVATVSIVSDTILVFDSLQTATPNSFTDTATFSETISIVTSGSSQSISITDTASFTETLVLSAIIQPLQVLASNTHWFKNPVTGQAVFLAGSQTWDTIQDTDETTSPASFDFNAYVSFLNSHGHNCTILWHKDLPAYFAWGGDGGGHTWYMRPMPWVRSTTSGASDGFNKWDLNTFDQTFFDRVRARIISLLQNNIYAIVEFFDGLGLTVNRGAADGYPFTGSNNINSVDDGYVSGVSGVTSMTMTATNAITAVQDAYVQKMIDTLHDLPNIIWEISEEAPTGSDTWWSGHMIDLVHTYETANYPTQKHPVLYPCLQGPSDLNIYTSNAESVAPSARVSSATNQGKVTINDSDHSYFSMWNDTTLVNRNYVWENLCNASSVLFMDPYIINWPGRNVPQSPVTNGIGTGPGGVTSASDQRWNVFRDGLGWAQKLANRTQLAAMIPQGSLSSTTWCLANTVGRPEYIIYAPSGGAFTVDLRGVPSTVSVGGEWLDPTTGVITLVAPVSGGSSAQSYTPPWGASYDAVLHLFALSPTDTLVFSELINLISSVSYNDSLHLSDKFSIATNYTDTSTETEKLAIISSIALTETSVFSDSIVIATAGNVALTITDTSSFTETISIVASLSVVDTSQEKESLGIAFGIVDSASFTDTILSNTTVAFSDTANESDILLVAGNVQVIFADTASFSDTFSISVSIKITDTSVETENLNSISFGVVDTFNFNDITVSNVAIAITETAAATESLIISSAGTISVTPVDIFGVTDTLNVAVSLGVTENYTLTDSSKLTVSIGDSFAFSDVSTENTSIGVTETFAFSDTLVIFSVGIVSLALSDTANFKDSINIGPRGFVDTAALTETLVVSYTINLNDTAFVTSSFLAIPLILITSYNGPGPRLVSAGDSLVTTWTEEVQPQVIFTEEELPHLVSVREA
jgi:Putative collagen-binding domain of a collagenase